MNMELNMTPLKTPHVFNNLKYKNENRFSSLYNSENCYEDDRVERLLEEINVHLVP